VRKAETAIQIFEGPAHIIVGAKIETDPLGE
jgi:hypothetical protein